MTPQVILHLSPAIRTTGDRFIAEMNTSVHMESESREDFGANAPLERTHDGNSRRGRGERDRRGRTGRGTILPLLFGLLDCSVLHSPTLTRSAPVTS